MKLLIDASALETEPDFEPAYNSRYIITDAQGRITEGWPVGHDGHHHGQQISGLFHNPHNAHPGAELTPGPCPHHAGYVVHNHNKWLVLNECISILENISQLGVPLPSFLAALLQKLKSTAEGKGEELLK